MMEPVDLELQDSTSPPHLLPLPMRSGIGYISEHFCEPDAELSFKSSDNVIFKVHQKYLSQGFTIYTSNLTLSRKSIQLPEAAAVLELLFAAMYGRPLPDLIVPDFNTLYGLAEAVEKYRVDKELERCKKLMTASLTEHPLEVFLYAAKYGYSDLVHEAGPKAAVKSPLEVLEFASKRGLNEAMDHAAVEALDVSLFGVSQVLQYPTLLVWLKFYDQWIDVSRQLENMDAGRGIAWHSYLFRVLRESFKTSGRLVDHDFALREVQAKLRHQTPHPTLDEWITGSDTLKALTRNVKSFSALLEDNSFTGQG